MYVSYPRTKKSKFLNGRKITKKQKQEKRLKKKVKKYQKGILGPPYVIPAPFSPSLYTIACSLYWIYYYACPLFLFKNIKRVLQLLIVIFYLFPRSLYLSRSFTRTLFAISVLVSLLKINSRRGLLFRCRTRSHTAKNTHTHTHTHIHTM